MHGEAGPGKQVLGTIRKLGDGTGATRMEVILDAGIVDVWTAVTSPEQLAHWVAHIDGDLYPGGRFLSRFTSGYEGPGRVECCEALQRLVVIMDPETTEQTVIEALLTAEGNCTRLVVEERGIPVGELAAHGAGWQVHIEDLIAHLGGQQPGTWELRWRELRPEYEEMAAPLQ